jgi:hypothetical protein
MTRNEGNTDRIIRAVIGITLIGLWMLGITQGILAVILAVVGAVLVLTSLVGFCPLYALFGINTCPVKSTNKA